MSEANQIERPVSRQTVVSYGAGTNSTAMVCEMVRRGEPIAAVVFADTLDRALLEQAVEELLPVSHNSTDDPRGQADKAIALLRAALEAQPSQPERKPHTEAEVQELLAFIGHYKAGTFDLGMIEQKVRRTLGVRL